MALISLLPAVVSLYLLYRFYYSCYALVRLDIESATVSHQQYGSSGVAISPSALRQLLEETPDNLEEWSAPPFFSSRSRPVCTFEITAYARNGPRVLCVILGAVPEKAFIYDREAQALYSVSKKGLLDLVSVDARQP